MGLVAALAFGIGFTAVPPWVKWMIVGLWLVGISVILFVVPSIRENE